jgi:hypothetical protein
MESTEATPRSTIARNLWMDYTAMLDNNRAQWEFDTKEAVNLDRDHKLMKT